MAAASCSRSRRAADTTSNLYWQRADGTGEIQRLTDSKNAQFPGSWHPSGKFLAFTEINPQTGNDVMILPMDGDEASGWKPGTPTVFLNSPFIEIGRRSRRTGGGWRTPPTSPDVPKCTCDRFRARAASGRSRLTVEHIRRGPERNTNCFTRRSTTGSWLPPTWWKATHSAPRSRGSGRRRVSCRESPHNDVRSAPGRRTRRAGSGRGNAGRSQAGQGRLHLQLLRRAAPDRAGRATMTTRDFPGQLMSSASAARRRPATAFRSRRTFRFAETGSWRASRLLSNACATGPEGSGRGAQQCAHRAGGSGRGAQPYGLAAWC